MLVRTLEPEVMDTVAEAVDYNSMDHSRVNRAFVDDLLAALASIPSPPDGTWRIFDAGTGTALIPLELMSRDLKAIVTASDLAEQMLVIGRENVRVAGLTNSIHLVRSDCKHLPDADASYHVAMSNSIVHHIPEPLAVLSELWRILKPSGLLFVRDLMRPVDLQTLDHLVQTYAGEANAHQQRMFRESLHAAMKVSEVSDLLEKVGVPRHAVRATSDRHWTIIARK